MSLAMRASRLSVPTTASSCAHFDFSFSLWASSSPSVISWKSTSRCGFFHFFRSNFSFLFGPPPPPLFFFWNFSPGGVFPLFLEKPLPGGPQRVRKTPHLEVDF